MSLALACLPFAGGGAGFYRAWTDDLPGGCPDIVPIQLPGREELFIDPPYTDALAAARELAPTVAAAVADYDAYAVFGHSLGAVLAFEVARELSRAGRSPAKLFVSGSPGPRSGREDRATGLRDQDFLARVEQFAGYRHEALDDPEFRELLLPLLRADVEMHENYKPATDDPIAVPIVSLRGAEDALVAADQAREWRQETVAEFAYVEVPGRHMYLADDPRALLEAVTRILAG